MGRSVTAMDVKLTAAVVDVLNVSEFCREQGISRTTFYKWRARFRADGLEGLVEKSRRPLSSRPLISTDVEDRIVQLRKQLTDQGHDAGPRSIHDYLRFEEWDPLPSVSSIWRALHRRGLITAQPEKRPRSSFKSFVYDRPNECWQIDDTMWRLADGTEVRIVEIIDDHSRTCVASRAVETATSQTAWAVFTGAAQQWGLPAMVLSDNGLAYNGSRRNITVSFEANLRTLGINPVAASPFHPQTCGKVERFHQTTKKWLRAQTRADSLSQLNNQLKAFTDYYNHQRPNRSLNGATPGSIHQQGAKAGPADQPITVSKRVTTAHVSTDGSVWSRPWRIAVGRKHAGLEVTCIINGDHAHIFTEDTILRTLTLDPTKTNQPLRCPP